MSKKPEEEGVIAPELYLLKGGFPDLKTMKKADLLIEIDMWRKIWQWVPSEVRYYVARTLSLGARLGMCISLLSLSAELGTPFKTGAEGTANRTHHAQLQTIPRLPIRHTLELG